jgi:hypothetical protein
MTIINLNKALAYLFVGTIPNLRNVHHGLVSFLPIATVKLQHQAIDAAESSGVFPPKPPVLRYVCHN